DRACAARPVCGIRLPPRLAPLVPRRAGRAVGGEAGPRQGGAMTRRDASCSCGQLSATTTGAPVRISIWHCLAGQRRNGSGLGGSVSGREARAPGRGVSGRGRGAVLARAGDEGAPARFHFCPDCGATVDYLVDAVAGLVALPAGAFADPGFPPPRVSVYGER